MFNNRWRGIPRDIAYGDIQAAGNIEINIVGARGSDADQFQPACSLQDVAVQSALVSDDDVGILYALNDFSRGCSPVECPAGRDRLKWLEIKVTTIDCIKIQKYATHIFGWPGFLTRILVSTQHALFQ
jgi:hypothetical protein